MTPQEFFDRIIGEKSRYVTAQLVNEVIRENDPTMLELFIYDLEDIVISYKKIKVLETFYTELKECKSEWEIIVKRVCEENEIMLCEEDLPHNPEFISIEDIEISPFFEWAFDELHKKAVTKINPISINSTEQLPVDYYRNYGDWLLLNFHIFSTLEEIFKLQTKIPLAVLPSFTAQKSTLIEDLDISIELKESKPWGQLICGLKEAFYLMYIDNVDNSIPEITDGFLSTSTEHTEITAGTESEGLRLPRELDTDRARKYFARAIERGMMQPTETGLKWVTIGERGGNAQLGYFLNRVYLQPRPITALEKFFRVAKLSTYIGNADLQAKRSDVISWRADIDRIFD